jgi:Domain of unknown function (DUF3472)/Domain of unknown function (DUF5077)
MRFFRILFSSIFLTLLLPNPCKAQQSGVVVQIPAFTAYAEPAPESIDFPDSGPVTGWSNSQTHLVWYGLLRQQGELGIAVHLTVPQGAQVTLAMKFDHQRSVVRVLSGNGLEQVVDFGSVKVNKTGKHKFDLTGIQHTGATFGSISSLQLSGAAALNTLFNTTSQRGAPSVHLTYVEPENSQIEWFYNEVTVKKDPIWSYYEACGFTRGYFGIQVNSPTERRIIFSVWDSSSEHDDRDKVASQNRVQLLAKGPKVFAGDFGHEGTGGHSHLVYPWKTGKTYRFLLHAQPEGSTTVYTAYFYFPEKHGWGMIASFRAPRDGNYLHHLYSFNEDFSGANGQTERLADFGNQWVRKTDGQWYELTKAKFTHTAINRYKERLDRGAGVVGDQFYLINGGFIPLSIQYGDMIERPSTGKPLKIILPQTTLKDPPATK